MAMSATPRLAAPLARRAAAAATLGVLAITAGCVADPVTDRGRSVADLYTWFMIAAAGVFGVVAGLLAWSIVRYRGQAGRDAELPPQSHGNLALEIVWWALPTALVVVLVILTAGVLSEVDARSDEPELTVEVQGFQWGWRFTFPEADVVVTGTAADPPTLLLPVDRTIAFEIVSADVVHSFNIPRFLIKRDAIPNRPNRFDVVIEEEGTYAGQCGEFCGLLHAAQLFQIDAVPAAEFEAWLAAAPRGQGSE
jgi:cytochrome c oxidase subunit II